MENKKQTGQVLLKTQKNNNLDNNKHNKDAKENIEKNKTSMKLIYKKLLKILKNKTFYFNCAECQSLQFTSEEISAIYCLDQKNFCLVIDPSVVKKYFNIRLENEKTPKINDEELAQSDCIYNLTICDECACVLGRFIKGVPTEKEKLKGKVLVLPGKVDAVIVEEFDCGYVNLRDYLLDVQENEEIKQFRELNEKLSRTVDEITDRMATVGDYLDIKTYVEESEAYADTLERLARYVNYLGGDIMLNKNN